MMTLTLEAVDFQVLDAKGPGGDMKVLVLSTFAHDHETGEPLGLVMRVNVPMDVEAARQMGELLRGEKSAIVVPRPKIEIAMPGQVRPS